MVVMSTRPLTTQLRRVDDALRTLVDERDHSDDPADILRAAESIDHWLDERLALMKTRDGESGLATTDQGR
ncbi:hypothetical protein [Jiangella sp. DSM 45060]|uniref:hypothetical protein n=1 Tax=Jiangella sp. DSM 45060 TaxID=1798224 RepID=UPI000B868A5D|nr:hypothetical protein [Jiangella sp. DSM 45060]